jgi:hypothetical protein
MAGMRSDLAAARLFLLGISACLVGVPAARSAPAEPEWVLQPPPNTADWLWGIGEGPDLEEAKRVALKDVAARLRVSVSSTTDDRVTAYNGSVDRLSRTRIQQDVQKMEFTNAILDKTTPSPRGVYALFKIDRHAFVKDTRARFDAAARSVNDATRTLETQAPIEQYKSLQASLPDIRTALALGELLRGADPGFDGEAILAPMASLAGRASRASEDLVFAVEFKPADADVARVVTEFLNGNGMRVTQRREGTRSLAIAITTSARMQTFFNSKSVLLQVMLVVRDGQMRSLASKQYEVNGSSMSDYDAARESAVAQLAEALREAGPASGLGL